MEVKFSLQTSLLVFSLALIGLFSNCNDPIITEERKANYFPLTMDSEWIYEIDSTHYGAEFNSKETFKIYRKEHIVSILDSGLATDKFNVDIYFKTDSTDWVYHSTEIAYKDQFKAVRKIGNVEVVSLIFPIKNRVYWDANQLNNQPEFRYRYSSSSKDLSALKDSFPITVFVEQNLDSNIIEENIQWELYADDVGLVEKKSMILEKQMDKKTGFSSYWKLISNQ